ncbi:PREDICTED: proteasome assembly chaperone 4-like isoform X2 [Vollenhovia emeryi]|nr:PREDICTED: proteasome assembly chaperone 4-like isoform X2 [Vollenhovia emeryi]XP_011881991.1 PREDICTED: proteasome assembly chaperone 4-like isoform X2 [Vollenhovia emeryi]XP_011881992.1 PREDICTED: proteasome assembly chaperone 4-like isoform X2 [Vollenhovia emeryi]XP_011881993.1 PREDICTED: proteasome assembly chaperone 4-like isoform X2 [Vollenhovia emeryi]
MASATGEGPEVELLPCSFKFHDFVAKVCDLSINCQIIKMEDSLYLWIGDSAKRSMTDLSFALASRFERQPIATKIMGSVADTTSMNMAKRLSTKLGKPIYVSFNVTADNIALPGIERRIQEEFKTHADLLSF